MRTRIAILLTAAVVLLAGPSWAEAPALRVAVEGAYPPFNEVGKGGKLKGLDIDIANALCERMSARCTFVVRTWDDLQDSVLGKNKLLGKDYDAIVSSMSITSQRRATADFTQRYYMSPARFLRVKGSSVELSAKGLAGKPIGVQQGTTHESFATSEFGGWTRISTFPTLKAAVDALLAGKVSAVLGDTLAFSGSVLKGKQAKKLELFGPSFTNATYFGEGAGIVVRKGNKELLHRFDEALTAIRADGTHEAILKRYFDVDLYGR